MDKNTLENPNKIINEMMSTIDILRDVYIRETEALDNSDARNFMALQSEKVEKANIYKERIEFILKRKDQIRQADPALKQKLHDMQADFAELATRNMKALQRMQRSTERLGQRMGSAARESARQNGSVGYGETGALNAASSKKPISIGIQETA